MAFLAHFCFFLVLFAMSISLSDATTNSVTLFVGSSVEISCASPLVPPMWSWVGVKQTKAKTLAFSGSQPHPNLNDQRFQFSQTGSSYILKLSRVKEADAGTFNCQGDSMQQTLLTVIR